MTAQLDKRHQLLMEILLESINRRETISYGEILKIARLKNKKVGDQMSNRFDTSISYSLLGGLNDAIDAKFPDVPAISAVGVNAEKNVPGPGIAGFRGFPAREAWNRLLLPEQREIAGAVQKQVYEYPKWGKIYKALFKENLPPDVATPMHEWETTEGEQRTQEIKVAQRNPSFAYEIKKKHGFKCQACDYYCRVDDKYIIDCHHKTPIGTVGTSVKVTERDLSVLCPNCHRIAHTNSKKPLSIKQIKDVLRKNRLL